MTILIVTHNMQQAARVSDFTAFMYLGELVEVGATSMIFTNPGKKATEDYITGRTADRAECRRWNNRRRPPRTRRRHRAVRPGPGRRPGRGSHLEDRRPVARRSAAARGCQGGLVIDQVASCVVALVEHDAKLAELVLSRETLVNAYDGRLDRDTLTFIALQQPVASDLRMVRAIARAGLELERIGDELEEDSALRLARGPHGGHDPVVAVSRYLRHMGELSVTMLRSAVRALDEADAGCARCWRAIASSTQSSAPRCDS